jgi:hypothetical protein
MVYPFFQIILESYAIFLTHLPKYGIRIHKLLRKNKPQSIAFDLAACRNSIKSNELG